MSERSFRISFSLLVLLISSFPYLTAVGQLKYDESLEKACKQMKGQFTMRKDDQAITGDTCSLKFQVAARDDADALEFCELYAPWRLQSFTREKEYTTCHVEATLACKNGWTQMLGHCFMMPDKNQVYTYDDGMKTCKSLSDGTGSIAYMHHRYIVGMWKNFFRGVGQIWVTASETWDQYIQKTGTVDGSALALAFTGKHFSFAVPHNALIRIDPNIKLQLLCEYKPRMTPAEINYLGRRYSEIYHDSVPVSNGILVRSASSYTRSSYNLDVCKAALKPFMIEVVGPFVPDEEALVYLSNHHPKNTMLTRAGAEARINYDSFKNGDCQQVVKRFEVKVLDDQVQNFLLKNVEEDITCDNMLSTAITHFDQKQAEMKIMSDSRSLPIWCKLGHAAKFAYTVPKDYQVFERTNGEYVAHRLFENTRTFEDAKKMCEDDGGFLTGVNSLKEAKFLEKLATEKNFKDNQIWLGGRRSDNCRNVNAFQTSGPCTRNKVIKWENNVATEFFDDWWKNGNHDLQNPDYNQKNQECLSFVVGNPAWADPKSIGFLDDISCDTQMYFYCTKKIEVFEIKSF